MIKPPKGYKEYMAWAEENPDLLDAFVEQENKKLLDKYRHTFKCISCNSKPQLSDDNPFCSDECETTYNKAMEDDAPLIYDN